MTGMTRKKILVIDDDKFLLATLRSFITIGGFEVETATRGDEALGIIRKNRPDLVIVDAIMPEMNGFELALRIHKLENAKTVPILMITGLRADSDKVTARGVGIAEFINKPVKPEELLKRIRFHLRTGFS
jgi:DNA-binding response OmpR family regulator